jgi:leucyl/phenylalanyl-tRNA--protein transferase
MLKIHWLDAHPESPFPPLSDALTEPNGLLAAGGDLSPARLLNAYRHGIFPWYNPGEPILWWSPDPRFVLFPHKLKISRSLRKTLNRKLFEVRFDTAFADVMHECAAPRGRQRGTWITRDMFLAYMHMHELGYAHSVECWQDNRLVGGLYGMALGRIFFGESMFSRVDDASKVALVHLRDFLLQHDFELIDSQVYTPHLESLGAERVPRDAYIDLLNNLSHDGLPPQKWTHLAADSES